MFCGDPDSSGYASCAEQESLFVIASLIPAMLALVLMVAAFATPAVRRNPALRAQTLGYSLVAWCIAGFTIVLGALPPL
ncbi:hypothetical protein LG943_20245 [Streptomonospora sp. S1-112]|uniref:Uncharacterized protein n=1 Tax=Streptomonospora mangrovi TaxID=2883123 RepID=A0A9X3SIS8_9ACTN|nr:hypothetical protein [Streptomonospora mangrovi]MDA0566624.1 hypothetical protein [Streptomonospora mangrovi]